MNYAIAKSDKLKTVSGGWAVASNPHIAIYPDYETAREYHDGGMETIFEAKVFSLDSKPPNTFTSEF